MWIILDKRGRPWRYETGDVVIWAKRQDAVYDVLGLDAKRGWKPVRVTVSLVPSK